MPYICSFLAGDTVPAIMSVSGLAYDDYCSIHFTKTKNKIGLQSLIEHDDSDDEEG